MNIETQPIDAPLALQWELWLYTNYDCNLRCSYCVAKSSPNAPRRALGLANVQRLVEEAVRRPTNHQPL
jgi:molybdenum cofactor biosynthesis enzyme MoaA